MLQRDVMVDAVRHTAAAAAAAEDEEEALWWDILYISIKTGSRGLIFLTF